MKGFSLSPIIIFKNCMNFMLESRPGIQCQCLFNCYFVILQRLIFIKHELLSTLCLSPLFFNHKCRSPRCVVHCMCLLYILLFLSSNTLPASQLNFTRLCVLHFYFVLSIRCVLFIAVLPCGLHLVSLCLWRMRGVLIPTLTGTPTL